MEMGDGQAGGERVPAGEAQLRGDRSSRASDNHGAGREERLVLRPVWRRAQPPALGRLVDGTLDLSGVACAEAIAREHTAGLGAERGFLGSLRRTGNMRARTQSLMEDVGVAGRGGEQRLGWHCQVDVHLVHRRFLDEGARAADLAHQLERTRAKGAVDAHVALAVRGGHLHQHDLWALRQRLLAAEEARHSTGTSLV
jgi:hypothetical protein